MEIREIVQADISGLITVRAATRENTLSVEQLERMGITEESVSAMIRSTHFGWVSEEGHRPVGFAMGDLSSGEMWAIAVLPEFEGRGIGAALLERVEDRLFSEGWEEIWLTTDVDTSLRAYRFYRNRGWLDHQVRDGLRTMKKRNPDLP